MQSLKGRIHSKKRQELFIYQEKEYKERPPQGATKRYVLSSYRTRICLITLSAYIVHHAQSRGVFMSAH